MASSHSQTGPGVDRRAASQSAVANGEAASREKDLTDGADPAVASNASPAEAAPDWGLAPKRRGSGWEVKVGLLLLLPILGVAGYLIYMKVTKPGAASALADAANTANNPTASGANPGETNAPATGQPAFATDDAAALPVAGLPETNIPQRNAAAARLAQSLPMGDADPFGAEEQSEPGSGVPGLAQAGSKSIPVAEGAELELELNDPQPPTASMDPSMPPRAMASASVGDEVTAGDPLPPLDGFDVEPLIGPIQTEPSQSGASIGSPTSGVGKVEPSRLPTLPQEIEADEPGDELVSTPSAATSAPLTGKVLLQPSISPPESPLGDFEVDPDDAANTASALAVAGDPAAADDRFGGFEPEEVGSQRAVSRTVVRRAEVLGDTVRSGQAPATLSTIELTSNDPPMSGARPIYPRGATAPISATGSASSPLAADNVPAAAPLSRPGSVTTAPGTSAILAQPPQGQVSAPGLPEATLSTTPATGSASAPTKSPDVPLPGPPAPAAPGPVSQGMSTAYPTSQTGTIQPRLPARGGDTVVIQRRGSTPSTLSADGAPGTTNGIPVVAPSAAVAPVAAPVLPVTPVAPLTSSAAPAATRAGPTPVPVYPPGPGTPANSIRPEMGTPASVPSSQAPTPSAQSLEAIKIMRAFPPTVPAVGAPPIAVEAAPSRRQPPSPAARPSVVPMPPAPPDAGAAQGSVSNAALEDGSELYTVGPNDNFWKISKQQYGTARLFRALTAYNQPRIGNPTQLRPGMQVAVPPRSVLEARFPGLIDRSGLAPTPTPVDLDNPQISPTSAVEPAPAGFFLGDGNEPLYRVGTQDTLTGIAQRHLGRASRWVEIYQQNRSALPNPDSLKVGSVLRLPTDASRLSIVPTGEPRR